MCTGNRRCAVSFMGHIADLMQCPLVRDPRNNMLKIEARYHFMHILIDLVVIDGTSDCYGPRMVLTMDATELTPAQFWSWYDAVEGLSEGILRVKGAIDKETDGWTKTEVIEATEDLQGTHAAATEAIRQFMGRMYRDAETPEA